MLLFLGVEKCPMLAYCHYYVTCCGPFSNQTSTLEQIAYSGTSVMHFVQGSPNNGLKMCDAWIIRVR